ncbi:MAG TPA: glutamine--fructose-6-phosphate transaminase (isomerizing), partial [Thermodesulfobacteriota bacterium]
LKSELRKKGYVFNSDTDTEVLSHLIEDFSTNGSSFEDSVRGAFKLVEGSYAVAIVSEREPEKIIAVRKFSPLIIALGQGENFIASDIPAILPYSRRVVFLEDGDVAILEKDSLRITDLDGKEIKREIFSINWDPVAIEKGGYKHFMLKEIHEQPSAVLDTIRGRISEENGDVYFEALEDIVKDVRKVLAIGCGTSYHSCLVGRYMIENIAKVPVDVDLASEIRYRDPIVDENTLAVAVSQSGETADTSEALLEMKRRGARTLAITNVPKSKMARESDAVIYTHAGPEIGVASTKAFTTQLIVFYLLSIYLGRFAGRLSDQEGRVFIRDAFRMPQLLDMALKLDEEIKELAMEFYHYKNFLYLGRGINYPIALEGALKLKEVSYIHAEGYAAGEMKHGPIALVDESIPVVIIAPRDGIIYKKVLGNLQEIRARRGKVILITSGDESNGITSQIDRLIRIPNSAYMLSPLIAVIPLQLFAYYIAVYKGTDVDQPRNLAKVVTVE